MKLTFLLGFIFVLIGMAISSGGNYLDLGNFEARLDHYYIAHTSLSNYSDLRTIAKSKDISPSISALLDQQLNGADLYIKMQLEEIRAAFSEKKSKELHRLVWNLLLAGGIGLVQYSAIRKLKGK